MGSNDSKQKEKLKTDGHDSEPKQNRPSNQRNLNLKYDTEKDLSEKDYKLRHPDDKRPIELSWLQQNRNHEHYNQSHPHSHQRHHHHSHIDHNPERIPIAINRWHKNDSENLKQKTKSFVEEYIRQ